MAINQNRYIDIMSSDTSGVVGDRDLAGLVFTEGEMVSGFTKKSDYDSGKVIRLTLQGAKDAFGSSSDEYIFAKKYFAYISPSGQTPSVISFAKILNEEDPEDALVRVDEETNNFGCFTFLNVTDSTKLVAAATVNAGFNYRYMMVVPCTTSTYSALSTALKDISGCHLVQGTDKYAAYMPMAIGSSIDFEAVNGTTVFMFKQFDGEVPTVTKDTVADTLDPLYVNYYGQTQTNGKTINFYQRGFNMDGLDAGCYYNEIWLKSAITTAYFNLITRVEKLPANQDGVGAINCIIADILSKALDNGTIIAGKELDSTQRSTIAILTGDSNAYATVIDQGYWADAVIYKDGNEYKVKYRIVYSKGDAIRFVEGYHNLV